MKTLLLFLATLPLAARPTLEEALRSDPMNGLVQEILPTPSDLPNDGGTDVSDYGTSVAIHGDVAAVSAPVHFYSGAGNPGAVYVFRRESSGWIQIQKLTPPDAREHHRFGNTIDLSEDGSILVIGSSDANTSSVGGNGVASGAYVYRMNEGNSQFIFEQKLVPAAYKYGDRSGEGVAISGQRIVVGSPGEDRSTSNSGALTIFDRDDGAGAWTEKQTIGDNFFNFTPIGNPGTFSLSGDRISFIDDFSDGASISIYRHLPQVDQWISDSGVGTSNNSSYRIQESGPTGILTNGHPRLRFYRGGPGNSFTQIDTSSITSPQGVLSATLNSTLIVANFGAGETVNPDPVLEFHLIGELATAPLGSTDTADHGRAISIDMDDHTVLITEFVTPPSGSSFRQVSAFVANDSNLIQQSRSHLFYEDAEPGSQSEAAFAYQTLLYDGSGPSFLTRHDQIDQLYGETHRENATTAEELLKSIYPTATEANALEIEHLFLEIAYGRAAANLIGSRDILRKLNQQRLDGTPLTQGSFFFLNDEIDLIGEAFERSAAALNPYLSLLSSPLGKALIDGNPSGRLLFAKNVPSRRLMPAVDTNGDPVNGSSDPLLTGYKDLVLLYEVLLQHTQNAGELAGLLVSRADDEDEDRARSIIGDTKRLVFEQRILIDTLFPQLDGSTRDSLGLTQLADEIDTALTELTAFESNLNGTINLLGYEPDFLMLVQTTDGAFDSFDTFKSLLTSSSSRLTRALEARTTALASISNYGENQDALDSEWTRIADLSNGAIGPRLFDIVGVYPGEPGYDTPQDNTGSEIEQQYRSIDIAKLRIERNGVEIANLREKIAIERRRRASEANINLQIADLIIDFGNRQASLTEEIGNIEAAQAYSNAAKDLFSLENLNPVNIVAGSINAGVQLGAELAKSRLEADKEQLAAAQDAQIRGKEDQILGANSQALISTWLLEMKTLAIDSQEAVVLLRQEAGRLTALYCEKADLERRLAAVTDRLASRYFADPIHRLRAINDTLIANIRFEEARKWLFFAARALEYKWNTPVDFPDPLAPGGRWEISDLYRMRNADELNDFFLALCTWDESDRNLNRVFVPADDWFSIREDYFGFELQDDATGEPRFYEVVDVDSGQIVNIGAVAAFRNELRRSLANCDDDPALEICLRFDTVRQNNFQTTTGQFNGTLFDPDNYLDRIEDLQVFIRGSHQHLEPQQFESQNIVGIEIGYAGTSFIRNETHGSVSDPDRPNRLAGEMTAYPTRFYRSNGSRFVADEGLIFKNGEALKILSNRSRGDINFSEPNAVTAFRERSVATTSWLLILTPDNAQTANGRLVIEEIDDIEIHINHRAVQR